MLICAAEDQLKVWINRAIEHKVKQVCQLYGEQSAENISID